MAAAPAPVAASSSNAMKFYPFSSVVHQAFWHQLADKKLNEYKLDTTPKSILGRFSNRETLDAGPRLYVDFDAFAENVNYSPGSFAAYGTVQVLNTAEEFKGLDKKALLTSTAEQVWTDICSSRPWSDPSLLVRFYLLVFAELKKFDFIYWFSFPSFSFENCTSYSILDDGDEECARRPLTAYLNDGQMASLERIVKYDQAMAQFVFVVVLESDDEVRPLPFEALPTLVKTTKKFFVAFCDPCPSGPHPGWPMRNLLLFLAYQLGFCELDLLCLRRLEHSFVLRLKLSPVTAGPAPPAVGWAKNERGQMGPQRVSLRDSMDPVRLSRSALELNLSLMRWRLMPELDLDALKNMRCLLFGAGTLGCNVARGLMAWGVKQMTLVDYGKISLSNPARQSLFRFDDVGKNKAEAAAESLRAICPGLDARAHVMTVPMPGHVLAMEAVVEALGQLHQLIDSHDVLFLLLDTREARWLPTVMAAAKRKVVINAALGFDSFLVMRHGSPESGLGCYFCNDVVAPANSTIDRTLDQQCTVSRPGASMLASALAVELAATLWLHPLRSGAPCDREPSCLGVVPHMIRGFLSRFEQLVMNAQAFDRCTACSAKVREHFCSEGADFVCRVLGEPSLLEKVTGLDELHRASELAEVMVLDDDDSDTASVGTSSAT